MELEFYLQRTIYINLGRTTCEFAPRPFLARVKSNIKRLSLSIFLYQPIPMEINCSLRIRKICTSPVDYAQVPIQINISSFHMTHIISHVIWSIIWAPYNTAQNLRKFKRNPHLEIIIFEFF